MHLEWFHLIGNLLVFYFFSIVEKHFGSGVFFTLIMTIWGVCVVMEWICRIYFRVECSVGFSSILFGLYTWMLVYDRKALDLEMTLLLTIKLGLPHLFSSNASLFGHVLGVISGLVVSLFFQPDTLK